MIQKRLLLAVLSVAALPAGASAQILWDNDGGDNDLMNAANWGDGASGTPNSSSGTYQIDTDTGTISWNTGGAVSNLIRATLNHNTGTVSRGAATAAASIDGTYNLNAGATLDLGSASNVAVRNGVFNFNGGGLTSTAGTFLVNDPDATVNVNGNLTTDLFETHTRGVLNLNAGIFSFTGSEFIIGNRDDDFTAFVNVFDGSLDIDGELQLGGFDDVDRAGSLTFDSTGNGSVSADSLDLSSNINNAINFETGTLGSLTIAGANTSFYEQIWNDGFLFVDGGNSGTFADSDFQVTGETLALIPEPSAAVLLLTGVAGLLVTRRRRA